MEFHEGDVVVDGYISGDIGIVLPRSATCGISDECIEYIAGVSAGRPVVGGGLPKVWFRHATPDDMRNAGFAEVPKRGVLKYDIPMQPRYIGDATPVYKLNDGTYWIKKEEQKVEEKSECLTFQEIAAAIAENPEQEFENMYGAVFTVGSIGFRGLSKGTFFSIYPGEKIHIKPHVPKPDPRKARISKKRMLDEAPVCWKKHIEDVFGDDEILLMDTAMWRVFEILGADEWDNAISFLRRNGLLTTNRYKITGKSFLCEDEK